MPDFQIDIAKEIKVAKLLTKMYESDKNLYMKILDTPGFAHYFSELANMARGIEDKTNKQTKI